MTDAVARLLEWPLRVPDRRLDPRAPLEPLEPLDAIVVLGAPLRPDGSLTEVLAERITAALALYLAGGAPRIVVTGGLTHGAPRAEAEAMAHALRAAGIPDAQILVEAHSRTTRENARETAALLAAHRVGRRVWLVTQPFHLRRALRVFTRAGLVPRPHHIADSIQYRDRRRATKWLVREYAAWLREALRRR